MKSRIILIVLLCVCIIVGIIFLLNRNVTEEKNTSYNTTENMSINTSIENYTNAVNNESNTNMVNNESNMNLVNNESENKMVSNIKVIVDGKKYNVKVEENKTAQSLVNMLPLELNMSELNGNEKYIYLDKTLPTNSYSPKHIEVGDMMLYGNDCLVVFYKSFDTPYSYTKIGHIENFVNLGTKDVVVKFER